MTSSSFTLSMVHDAEYRPPDALADTQDPAVPHLTEKGTVTDFIVKVAVVVTVRPVAGSVPLEAPSTTMPSRHTADAQFWLSPPEMASVALKPVDAASFAP